MSKKAPVRNPKETKIVLNEKRSEDDAKKSESPKQYPGGCRPKVFARPPSPPSSVFMVDSPPRRQRISRQAKKILNSTLGVYYADPPAPRGPAHCANQSCDPQECQDVHWWGPKGVWAPAAENTEIDWEMPRPK